MLTRAQAARQRRELRKEIAREHRKQQKAQLGRLLEEIRAAKAHRKAAIHHARIRCRALRVGARARAIALRKKLLEDLRAAVKAERDTARHACTADLRAAKGLKDAVARARAELAAERKYRRELRLIESNNRKRHQEHKKASRSERRGESDDEVRGNIPPEMVRLFDRVKRQIKASDRMSRTEAFLHYAEEHPAEVLEVLEDRTSEVIADLERQYAAGRSSLRSRIDPARAGAAPADLPPF